MPRAIWNGVIVAESPQTAIVEGNHYFPPESLRTEHFRPSQTHTTCGWKGQASYYDLVVAGQINRDAATRESLPTLPTPIFPVRCSKRAAGSVSRPSADCPPIPSPRIASRWVSRSARAEKTCGHGPGGDYQAGRPSVGSGPHDASQT